MSPSKPTWGCCVNGRIDEINIKCTICKMTYHYACLGLESDKGLKQGVWKCPSCLGSLPKGDRSDSTPVRNVTVRGNKRPAANSSPEPPSDGPVTREDVSNIVTKVIQEQFRILLSNMNEALISKLKPLQGEIAEMVHSMEHMNAQFEDVLKEQKVIKESMITLESERKILKDTVTNLKKRIDQMEQHARSKNIEIQSVLERKQEDLVDVVVKLGKSVDYNINGGSILNVSRVAKMHKDNTRPRSIVVELASQRIRDELLARVIKYNKANPQNKLHSAAIGISGHNTPIYVSEHLSPFNKDLHAATRLRTK